MKQSSFKWAVVLVMVFAVLVGLWPAGGQYVQVPGGRIVTVVDTGTLTNVLIDMGLATPQQVTNVAEHAVTNGSLPGAMSRLGVGTNPPTSGALQTWSLMTNMAGVSKGHLLNVSAQPTEPFSGWYPIYYGMEVNMNNASSNGVGYLSGLKIKSDVSGATSNRNVRGLFVEGEINNGGSSAADVVGAIIYSDVYGGHASRASGADIYGDFGGSNSSVTIGKGIYGEVGIYANATVKDATVLDLLGWWSDKAPTDTFYGIKQVSYGDAVLTNYFEDKLGIGTTAPRGMLEVAKINTATPAGNVATANITTRLAPQVHDINVDHNAIGLLSDIDLGGETTNGVKRIYGIQSRATVSNGSTNRELRGTDSWAIVESNSLVQYAYGDVAGVNVGLGSSSQLAGGSCSFVYAEDNGTIGQARGLESDVENWSGGSFGTTYGLRLYDFLETPNSVAQWGIYQVSDRAYGGTGNASNYLQGATGIGTLTPRGMLDVAGTINVDTRSFTNEGNLEFLNIYGDWAAPTNNGAYGIYAWLTPTNHINTIAAVGAWTELYGGHANVVEGLTGGASVYDSWARDMRGAYLYTFVDSTGQASNTYVLHLSAEGAAPALSRWGIYQETSVGTSTNYLQDKLFIGDTLPTQPGAMLHVKGTQTGAGDNQMAQIRLDVEPTEPNMGGYSWYHRAMDVTATLNTNTTNGVSWLRGINGSSIILNGSTNRGLEGGAFWSTLANGQVASQTGLSGAGEVYGAGSYADNVTALNVANWIYDGGTVGESYVAQFDSYVDPASTGQVMRAAWGLYQTSSEGIVTNYFQDKLGIGTTAPRGMLEVVKTVNGSNETSYATVNDIVVAPAAPHTEIEGFKEAYAAMNKVSFLTTNGLESVTALKNDATVDTGSTNTYITGNVNYVGATHSGVGVRYMVGVESAGYTSDGHISDFDAIRVDPYLAGGTIGGSLKGIMVDPYVNGATVNNYYGVYIKPSAATAPTSSYWGLYQAAGTGSASNYLASPTLFGSSQTVTNGTFYPSNSVLPSASAIGAGGFWIGNSNGVPVMLRSADGATTTMKEL